MKPTCTGPECDRAAVTKGLCGTHHRQSLRTGTLTVIGAVPPVSYCTGPGPDGATCGREAHGHGLCKAHRGQLTRGGTLRPLRIRMTQPTQCTGPAVDGTCTRKAVTKGLCPSHYAQLQRGAPLAPIGAARKRHIDDHCTGPECTRPLRAQRLCTTHYDQARAGGPLTVIGVARVKVPCPGPQCDRLATRSGLCPIHLQQMARNGVLAPIAVKVPARPKPPRTTPIVKRAPKRAPKKPLAVAPDSPAARARAVGMPDTWFNTTVQPRRNPGAAPGGSITHDTIGLVVPSTPDELRNAATATANHSRSAAELEMFLQVLGIKPTTTSTKAAA